MAPLPCASFGYPSFLPWAQSRYWVPGRTQGRSSGEQQTLCVPDAGKYPRVSFIVLRKELATASQRGLGPPGGAATWNHLCRLASHPSPTPASRSHFCRLSLTCRELDLPSQGAWEPTLGQHRARATCPPTALPCHTQKQEPGTASHLSPQALWLRLRSPKQPVRKPLGSWGSRVGGSKGAKLYSPPDTRRPVAPAAIPHHPLPGSPAHRHVPDLPPGCLSVLLLSTEASCEQLCWLSLICPQHAQHGTGPTGGPTPTAPTLPAPTPPSSTPTPQGQERKGALIARDQFHTCSKLIFN